MNSVNFPIELKLPVLWGDQDMFRHVNNTIHLKWFESSRVAYWETTGMRQLMEPQHLAPILASVTCHYRHQIRYPDTVTVAARAVRQDEREGCFVRTIEQEAGHAFRCAGHHRSLH